MSLGQQVAGHLPYLRRYARALTGSQSHGDALVRSTLEAVLVDDALRESLAGGKTALYHAFNRVWAEANRTIGQCDSDVGEHEIGAQTRLASITPLNRQALLLTTLEGFSPLEVATIMETSAAEVEALVAEAIAEIDREQATSVLIIEDEPLISMQLEDLVSAIGHEICGTAATRTQARAVIEDRIPGLVLADIQLADGSSGLDAVDDILAVANVPVIFITAYPERLLTGDRPEPTYLVTKPFQESTVRAAISQALFFRSGKPL
jgi:DNA-directed RNA polymerase specialized sigma24 family protein